jgi:hypothetical protein
VAGQLGIRLVQPGTAICACGVQDGGAPLRAHRKADHLNPAREVVEAQVTIQQLGRRGIGLERNDSAVGTTPVGQLDHICSHISTHIEAQVPRPHM